MEALKGRTGTTCRDSLQVGRFLRYSHRGGIPKVDIFDFVFETRAPRARGYSIKAQNCAVTNMTRSTCEGVFPFCGIPYLPTARVYRESVFGVSKNMRPKLDRFPMYVRYPNKSNTLKGIPANMPPVKTCHSSPAGNGCYVGRFLMAAF